MSSRKKPNLTNAEIARMRREAVLRRQGGKTEPVIILGGPADDDPIYGRPPEVRALDTPQHRYEQPAYPGLVVDPSTCAREIAFIRDMVAKHPDKKFPVGPIRVTQGFRKAAYWLRAENRNPLRPWVEEFMRVKENGAWDDHHQTPLAFNQSGLLCDGLKRVIAGILMDEPEYEDYVWFGIKDASFDSIDTGAPRKAPQTLKVKGVSYHSLLSQMVNLRHRINNPGKLLSQQSVFRGCMAIKDLPVIQLALPCAYALRKMTGVTLSSAALAYWIIAEEPRNELLVGAFWDHLVEGTHMTRISPVRVCRNKLIRECGKRKRKDTSQGKPSKQYLFQVEQVAWIIMAWNLWTNDLPKPSDAWPDWKGLPVLENGKRVPVRDVDGEVVMEKDPETGEDTKKVKYQTNKNPEHSLPPLGAADAWGRGDPVTAQQNRDRVATFAKRRQRTPGNVYRAQQ